MPLEQHQELPCNNTALSSNEVIFYSRIKCWTHVLTTLYQNVSYNEECYDKYLHKTPCWTSNQDQKSNISQFLRCNLSGTYYFERSNNGSTWTFTQTYCIPSLFENSHQYIRMLVLSQISDVKMFKYSSKFAFLKLMWKRQYCLLAR